MDTTKKIEEINEQVCDDEHGKWDAVVPRRDLALRDGKLSFPDTYSGGYPTELLMNPWSATQFCQKLSIPTAYFRRCPAVLRDMQANYWLRHPAAATGANDPKRSGDLPCEPDGGPASVDYQQLDELWLLRAKYGNLRGVLSDRYARFDNTTLMGILATLPLNRYKIGWFGLSDESLHLRLIDPATINEALPGDRLMAGVHIANSEVGKRAVTVDAIVFRLLCTNGLIYLVKGKNLLHQRHMHVSDGDIRTTIAAAVHNAVVAAESCLERFRFATSQHIKDVDAELDRLSLLWDLPRQAQVWVKQALLKETPGQQETLYGVINAFTNVAQRLPNDDRYHLEMMAGKLLQGGSGPDFLNGANGHRPRNGIDGHALPAPVATLSANGTVHRRAVGV